MGMPDAPRDPGHPSARPEYHLLPPHNWMNDPNGPIWWKGKYVFQLNPNAGGVGRHALGACDQPRHGALAPPARRAGTDGRRPRQRGVLQRIGGGVQRRTHIHLHGSTKRAPDKVTLRDGNDKLRETQMLATAEDDGLLRWKKVEKPVIAAPPDDMRVTGFRDPCVWKEADGWYCGVGSGERGKGGSVLLYRSEDLRKWEYLHPLTTGIPNGKQAANPCDSGEMWECPDFFALDKVHYLQYSSEGKVIWTIGDYDAHAHTYSPRRRGVLDHGAYYAPKTFQSPDGRRILWGWIRETRPEAAYSAAGWAGCMSLPRVLSVGEQGQLEMRPASEVLKLRGPSEKGAVEIGKPFRKKLGELRQELYVPVDFTVGTVMLRLLVGGTEVWQLR